MAKAARRFGIDGFFSGRLGSRMTCAVLSFGEALTRCAVRLLIAHQERASLRQILRPAARPLDRDRRLAADSTPAGSVRSVHRVLAKLVLIGIFALVQMPWFDFANSLQIALYLSAVFDIYLAVNSRMRVDAPTITYWDEAALFCLCAGAVRLAA